MKTLIYQYWYGSEPLEGTLAGRDNMKEYAERIGADYEFARDPEFFGGKCEHPRKYSALRPIYDDKYLEYDKVMYVDLDVFTVDNLKENIFDIDFKHIAICEEEHQPEIREKVTVGGNIGNKCDEIWASAIKNKFGKEVYRDQKGRPRVFNSGLVLFTREGLIQARKNFIQFQDHINFIKKSKLKGFYISDQTYYQTMMVVSGVDFKIIPSDWNVQVHYLKPSGEVYDPKNKNTKMVHVQLSGADHHSADWHHMIVNKPKEDWSV